MTKCHLAGRTVSVCQFWSCMVYAMSKSLPTGGFKWLHPAKFHLDKCDDECSRGCVLEVDLEYPKKLHKLHKDYPLAADKLEIKKEMLSD